MRLHSLLQDDKFPNCTKLARELEISVRTLKRDVAFMKSRLNLPVEYDSRRYGYYYSRPVKNFPNVHATETDLMALKVAHKAVAQYRGTGLQKPLEGVFQKLAGQMQGDLSSSLTLVKSDETISFRPFAPAEADSEIYAVVTSALCNKTSITFDYKASGARKTQNRYVQPYHLACVDSRWCLIAYDINRKAMRTFVLMRMSRVQLTNQTFEVPNDFKAEQYLKGSLKMFRGEADFEVVIQFNRGAADLIRERKWHASQQITDLPGGGVQMQMRLNSLEEIEGWILSWGKRAKVLQPQELINRLKKTISSLVKIYEQSSNGNAHEKISPCDNGWHRDSGKLDAHKKTPDIKVKTLLNSQPQSKSLPTAIVDLVLRLGFVAKEHILYLEGKAASLAQNNYEDPRISASIRKQIQKIQSIDGKLDELHSQLTQTSNLSETRKKYIQSEFARQSDKLREALQKTDLGRETVHACIVIAHVVSHKIKAALAANNIGELKNLQLLTRLPVDEFQKICRELPN